MIFRTVTATPAAEFDIADAASSYEATWFGLGVRFLDDIRQVRTRIEQFPDSCPEIHPSVRRALMHNFPFGVLYRVLPDTVQIIAVLPTKANPMTLAARAAMPQA